MEIQQKKMSGTIESEVISGCYQNDRQSQYLLYKSLAPRLLPVCLRYLKEKEEAEDCLQESFIKIFQHLNRYRGESTLYTWAHRIVVTTALNKLRKSKKLPYFIEEDECVETKDEPLTVSGLEAADLLNLINSIPVTLKTVFNLYAIEGYSHKEISELLGIRESTSRGYLTRARDLLKQKINMNEHAIK